LIARGELSEADRERVEFQRKMTKYVGAPLLGAFSCAAGAAMFAQIANPVGITGAPSAGCWVAIPSSTASGCSPTA